MSRGFSTCTRSCWQHSWPPAAALRTRWVASDRSSLAAGVAVAALFVMHALRHAEPVVPPRLFRGRHFSISAIAMFTYNVAFAAILLGITLLLTQGMHLSVLGAAMTEDIN